MEDKKTKLVLIEKAKHFIMNGDDSFEENLANVFDDNYYDMGYKLSLGKEVVEVESLWTDDNNHILIHVCNVDFEGDILMKSLNQDNQRLVLEMLWERTINED